MAKKDNLLDYEENIEDLRRYQQEYYTAKSLSDISSLRSAIEFLRGNRKPPNPVFYQAQELVQDLKEHRGFTLSQMTQYCGVNPSTIKRLSSGDFRSITYLHTIRIIRKLEPLINENGAEAISHSFMDPTSRRERRKRRKQKRAEE